jgi:hypothetical protein
MLRAVDIECIEHHNMLGSDVSKKYVNSDTAQFGENCMGYTAQWGLQIINHSSVKTVWVTQDWGLQIINHSSVKTIWVTQHNGAFKL